MVKVLTFPIFSYKVNAVPIQIPKGFWLVIPRKQKVVWDFSEGSLNGINSSGSCTPLPSVLLTARKVDVLAGAPAAMMDLEVTLRLEACAEEQKDRRCSLMEPSY